MVLSPFARKSQSGFTLLEMLFVVGIIIIGSAIAIPVTMKMVNDAKGDSASVMTNTFLQTARNRAVAERRNFILTFLSDNSMQVERVEVPSGLRTIVDTLVLEGEQEFEREGLTDTPDRSGGATLAINFTGVQPVMFTSDGSLIDSAGDVSNGTIFITKPGSTSSARAVTVSGVTGLLHTWKWSGTQWQ